MLDSPEKTAEMDANDMDIHALEQKASDIAVLLKAMGNERRLVILCQLVAQGEMSVGAMVEKIGLGQSALSQHLAKMREEGIVATRRDGQTIYYRVKDGRVEELMAILHRLYCKV